ncbi:urea transporter 2 isoform X1 [Amia ocellicauda]|uniref:urea transporter 2 isoform X1 n=2 Tax=Amia ocellicauda TaxID=2972642 RepID=UPI00346406FE
MNLHLGVELVSHLQLSLALFLTFALSFCSIWGRCSSCGCTKEDKPFMLQLLEWSLRGVAQVILVNNPLSGAIILCALTMHSPWHVLLGTVGLLSSTLTALIIGQNSKEVSQGFHGFNGMLVAILISLFSARGDWYWWLLIPCCLAGATCTFLYSGLSTVLGQWDLPVGVFPFNMVIMLYLACTGTSNAYFPHQPVPPPGMLEHGNHTELDITRLLVGVPVGVGQVYACDELWASVVILAAVFLFSPLMCAHALLGSGLGILAGLSLAVSHVSLYSGLMGLNSALGCMSIGGLFYILNWKTHLLAIASAFLSAYSNIGLTNVLGMVGLPASTWAATLTVTLMMLLTGQSLSSYRLPLSRVSSPEHSLRTRGCWTAADTNAYV